MEGGSSEFVDRREAEGRWYDLFSRGARDWLRHNDKVREAVRQKLPELVAKSDMLPHGETTVRVPVRFLEHSRFRLRDDADQVGAGQGEGKPGDQLVGPRRKGGQERGPGGNEDGSYQFMLELAIDDIVDWLWEELNLPHLRTRTGGLRDEDYIREGWNRRGVRSRLDRRRSVRESLKRRAIRSDGPPFTDDDLRYRQLVVRRRPSTEAVVFLAMDVSSSMTERDRRLAKSFFFWAVQGLRRQYTELNVVFIAHTVEAWEFDEDEFFQVTGAGGTVASTAFRKTLEVIGQRFDPGRYNIYLFYASDGANFRHDRDHAAESLAALADIANYVGYVETVPGDSEPSDSETAQLFRALLAEGRPAGVCRLDDAESVWDAIRGFFQAQPEPATRD